jgi:phosphohistidine phosphatase
MTGGTLNLVLWRHAEAEDGLPDDERRLTARGRRQAAAMASWLDQQLPRPRRVLSSPARRARETAAALCADAVIEAALSTAATPAGLLQAAGWPNARDTVVVVGHQPTLGAAAALALTGSAEPWAIKKGAIWWLRRDEDGSVLVRAVLAPGSL